MTGHTVWLASYPKSGNTWFRAVYSAWRGGGLPDLAALGPIASSRERFDDALGISSSDLTPGEIAHLRPSADEVVDSDFPDLHLEKIHDKLHFGEPPRLIVSERATRCAIYVMRDPRDVAVSLAHHMGISPSLAVARLADPAAGMSLNRDDISGQLGQHLGNWSEHVSSWVDHAPFPVHAVRYEDCVSEPTERFLETFSAAGFEFDPNDLSAAVDRSTFAQLKAIEAEEGFAEAPSRLVPFFRKGEAGAWHDTLTPELAAEIGATHHEVMTRFGYLPSPGGEEP